MSILYRSASGREVSHASSSSLDGIRFCRRKFRLSRIDGWKEKTKKASLEFGKAIESAVQFYSDNGLKDGDAVSEFERLWLKWADNTELVYTDQEKNFWDLLLMGREMMQLFEILLPTLPIHNPKWQLCYEKKLWPGTDLDDLSFKAYIDLLSTLEDGSRLLIDIKTAKSLLPVSSNMIALDGQLRKYAWVTGIREVGFLNFVKSEPNSFRKGVEVHLLEDIGDWKAGQKLVVWKYFPPTEATEDDNHAHMFVSTEEVVQKLDEELEQIKGKGSTEAKASKTAEYVDRGDLKIALRDQVTKTRLQFIRGTIPEEDIPEIGQQIGDDMLAMKNCHDTGRYPADGGVRFPNAVCGWCNLRGICLKDDKLVEELLVQIKPAKTEEEDWLKELESEDGE